jgi:hypothetical protein
MRAKILITILAVLLPLNAGAWETGDLRLRGRLQTRFEAEEKEDGEWTSAFRVRRARFDGMWLPSEFVRLVLEFEGAGMLDLNNAEAHYTVLKDAYGRFELGEVLRIQLGHFKKPFSRVKMTSPFKLFLPARGMLNRHAVARGSHGGYGGRDVGLMISGRFKELARLQYYLGAFSGIGFIDGVEESHKDIVGRLQARPFKGLRVAVNASHKLYHSPLGKTLTANLFGADIRYKIAGFTLLLEGAYGDNVDLGPGHTLWGFHGTLAYSLTLEEVVVITPAVMAEVFNPDGDDQAVRLAGALNLDFVDFCRLIFFAEGAISNLPGDYRLPTRFFVQVNMAF